MAHDDTTAAPSTAPSSSLSPALPKLSTSKGGAQVTPVPVSTERGSVVGESSLASAPELEQGQGQEQGHGQGSFRQTATDIARSRGGDNSNGGSGGTGGGGQGVDPDEKLDLVVAQAVSYWPSPRHRHASFGRRHTISDCCWRTSPASPDLTNHSLRYLRTPSL